MRALIALLGLAGCFAPNPPPGSPCTDGACPTGLVCSPASQTCERTAVDAALLLELPIPIDAVSDAAIDAPPDAAPPGVQLRQQAVNADPGTDSLSITLAASPQLGNLLVMVGGNVSGALTVVQGGGVATWTRATRSLVHQNVELWYGVVSQVGNQTVTIQLPGSTLATTLWVGEFDGLAIGLPLDGAVANDGVTSVATTGAITTQHPDDLLVFAVACTSPNTFGTVTPGTWSAADQASSTETSQGVWYQIVASAGSYAPSIPVSCLRWDAAIAAFELAP